MILTKLIVSQKDLSDTIRSVVKQSFSEVAMTGMSGNRFANRLQDAQFFATTPDVVETSAEASVGNKRFFMGGYSFCGGSHIATN